MRTNQRQSWLIDALKEHLWTEFQSHSEIQLNRKNIEEQVLSGDLSVGKAVHVLWNIFQRS